METFFAGCSLNSPIASLAWLSCMAGDGSSCAIREEIPLQGPPLVKEIVVFDAQQRPEIRLRSDGTCLSFSYDQEGRIVEVASNDRTMHVRIAYRDETAQIEFRDLLHDAFLLHSYNASGDLIAEETNRFSLQWIYDEHERCTGLFLPDGSSIRYAYGEEGVLSVSRKSPAGDLLYECHGSGEVQTICNAATLLGGFEAEPAYDERGNVQSDASASYRYDALDRLIEIETGERRVAYAYDFFSRLREKTVFRRVGDLWEETERRFFLHHGMKEIGTLDEAGAIRELRVLGPGICEDLGAAVSIERDGAVFFPLHDSSGHLVALRSEHGAGQTYAIDPFGCERQDALPLSPWRFFSKREEEGLWFFGRRVYHPGLQQWLTPDPLEHPDGPNPYAFLRNAPLAFLDAWGLYTELLFQIHLPLSVIPILANDVFHCKGLIGETKADWAVSCGFLHLLEITDEERAAGQIDLARHLKELVPEQGSLFGLLTYQNGVKTTLSSFLESCRAIREKIPEGTLLIGLHNKTKGLAHDIVRLVREVARADTHTVKKTRIFLGSLVEEIHRINPELLWGHLLHSEAGAISRRAIEKLEPEQRELLKKHLHVYAMGPALPIPMHYACKALNVYSAQDFVGLAGMLLGMGGYSLAYRLAGSCDYAIRFLPCSSSWKDRSLLVVDHSFLGHTYSLALARQIERWRKKYRLYEGAKNIFED